MSGAADIGGLWELSPVAVRAVYAFTLAVVISLYGRSKNSLNNTGAVAAVGVGTATFFSGQHFGFLLIAFFLLCSKITKYDPKHTKKQVEEDFKEGGQRNYLQVFANSLCTVVLCVLYCREFGAIIIPMTRLAPWPTFLQAAYLGYHRDRFCCLLHVAVFLGICLNYGLVVQLGILSEDWPRLVTTCKRVRPGTNGGMSILGTIASIVGGTVMGICYWYFYWQLSATDVLTAGTVLGVGPGIFNATTLPPQWPIVAVGTLAGFVGSLVDSLLGATLQYSGYCSEKKKVVSVPSKTTTHITGLDVLDNNQVNFIAGILTALITGYIALFLF